MKIYQERYPNAVTTKYTYDVTNYGFTLTFKDDADEAEFIFRNSCEELK